MYAYDPGCNERTWLYNVHRWLGLPNAAYLEPDPLTMESGRPSFYSYADQRPSRLTDPLGLAVMFSPECSKLLSTRQRRTIQAAAEDADAAGFSCLTCPERDTYRKAIRGLTIRCVGINFDVCGLGRHWCGAQADFTRCDPTPLPGNTIILTPDGAIGQQCPCLPRVIMHEVLHLFRGSGHPGGGDTFPEVRSCLASCGRGYPGIP